ncbi:MAG TPA: hypothetical protein VLZ77_15910, partial [Acidimicrobiales bacterium]|nr:hypothetical protein [Acidimicrobiales bacterium]
MPTSDDAHTPNALAGAAWECTSTPPGALAGPEDLHGHSPWWPAAVPGTAAGALLDAGVALADLRDYDQDDWWFRCRFEAPPGAWILELGGVATMGDVWMDGAHVLSTTNMFRRWAPRLALEGGHHELVIRCSALAPALAGRRPRPRWKTYLVAHQNLRWFRTSLLGRIPGWAHVPAAVGPWRAVSLTAAQAARPRDVRLAARCEGPGGVVDVSFRLDAAAWRAGGPGAGDAEVRVADVVAPMSVDMEGDEVVLVGQLTLPQVARWWPHTHGDQPRYAVTARLAGADVPLGRVGFRTVTLDRSGDGFRFVVNDEPVFCRGACWFPPDPVRPGGGADEVRRTLLLARDAHMNMVRVPGTSVYEETAFFDLCDELGILVWHDCMFAFMDPPDDDTFNEEVTAELTQVFAAMSGHPSLTVVCGGQEIEEVAAMNGLPPDRWSVALLEKTIPDVLEAALPGVPYVTSNPSGGDLPFRMDAGVCQYFGVGGYMRPVEDARLANVRFAAECLAYSTPPEVAQVEEWGGSWAAGHDPTWKRGLHHDAGRSWDMEDVRDFYMRALFKVDPLEQRYVDADRALDLGRATNAALMEAVFSEWRRPGSSCAGGLVLGLRDLRRGAGWGLVDAAGIPKAPWYALRRVWAPVTVIVTDEGLNGLHCHVINDTAESFRGSLRVSLYTRGELRTEEAERAVEVAARGSCTVRAETMLDGFRDVSYAYRFAPPAQDVVAVTLLDPEGGVVAEAVYLPLGQARPVEADLGLRAEAVGGPED